MNFESLLEHIGECGIYQILVAILCCLLSVFGVESIAMVFISAEQDHWCFVPQLIEFSHEQQKNIAIPMDAAGDFSSCMMFDLNYTTYTLEELLSWNRSAMVDDHTGVVKCESWVYDQTQFSSTSTSRYNLVCNKSGLRDLSTTLLFGGILVCSLVTGIISDKFGRKVGLMTNIVIKLLSGILVLVADDYILFCIGKFFQGWGSFGCYQSGFIIVMEIVGSAYRTSLGVASNISFAIGIMVVSGLAYAIRDDRMLQLAMLLPNIIFISYVWLLPESPRWLLERRRYKKAGNVLKKIAKVNGKHFPEHIDLYALEKEKIEILEPLEQQYCLALVKTKRLRVWTLVLCLHWFVNSLVYYSLTLNTAALSGDVYLNLFLSGLIEIPAHILVIFCFDWRFLGRRLTSGIALVASGMSCFITIPLLLYDFGTAHTAVSLIGRGFVTISFSGLTVYSGEIFPTEVRNTGFGVCSMVARVGGMAAPYMGAPLTGIWLPMQATIFGASGTIAGALTYFLPETRGCSLTDTVEEAEAFGRPCTTTKSSTTNSLVDQNSLEISHL